MKKGVLKVVISLILVFSLYENTMPVYALPPYVALAMPRREQQKSKWCWAASAQMVGDYYGMNHSQAQIVYQIKESYADASATDSETTQAINFALPQGKKAVLEDNTKTETFIKTKLAQGFPIPIKMLWNTGWAHIVVLAGYDTDGKLTLIDLGVNCATRTYSYSSLKNGTTIQSGTGRYIKTWIIN